MAFGRTIFHSLRSRLLLLVMVAVVPMAGLLFYNALHERQEAERQVRGDAENLISDKVREQEQLIEGSRQLTASIAGLTLAFPTSSLTQASCGAVVKLVLNDLSFYSNLGLAAPDGRLLCSAVTPPTDVSLLDAGWFRRAVQRRSFTVGVFETDPITGVDGLTFGYPVLDPRGEVRMLVFLTLDNDWWDQITEKANLGEGAVFTLYDNRGTIIYRYPAVDGLVGQYLPQAPDFRRATVAGTGVESLEGADGTERLYAFTPVGDVNVTGLFASVGVPENDAYAAVSSGLRRNLLVLLALGAIALVATYVATDLLILRPTQRLLDVTKRVSAGDLSARSHLDVKLGELGVLANAIDEMASALEQRDAQRAQHERQISEANRALEQSVAELKRSNEDLEQFAYVASHDLQEPLRMISSYTQLLSRRYRGQLDGDADEFISYAVDGAARMQGLITDLLAFSRVGTKQRPLAPVNMEKVYTAVMQDLAFQVQDADAVVTHDSLPSVMGDETQMGQLLQNLIGNAIKFRSGAVPAVHVSAAFEDGSWHFTVADNGIGIPPEHFERIFVIFQRLHGRTEYSGTGIGLAISKRIVERHGGRIWVESEPGRGSKFHFTLNPASSRDGFLPAQSRQEAAA